MPGDRFSQILSPYFSLAACFGVWSSPTWQWASRIYSTFTLALIAFNVSRGISFMKFDGFSPALVFKFILILYASHCMLAYWTMRLIQSKKVIEFVELWRLINEGRSRIPKYRSLKLLTWAGVFYVVSVSVLNGLYVGLGSINIVISFPFMDSYFVLDELAVINGFNVGFTSILFCVIQTLYMSVCAILGAEYAHYNKSIKNLTLQNVEKLIPKLRYQHHNIVRLTDRADEMLNWYAFAIYALNLPTLVTVAFLLARDFSSLSPMSQFTFVFWVGILLMQVGLVSVPPSIVNHLAHKPLAKLENLSNNLPAFASRHEIFWELSLFISQLTSRGIGITGGGFFLINKPMILTLVSLVVTYFAILIQFDMAAAVPCQCKC